MELVTRTEAKQRELKRYFTGEPCKHGHVSERKVSDRMCCECSRLSVRAWDAANPERRYEVTDIWRKANPERKQKTDRAWFEANQRVNGSNPEAYARFNEATKRYEVAVARATPAWSDREQCIAVYAAAGKGEHVDHIVPIQSDWVCGLHVPANLRVLDGAENCSKKNRYWPDMPDVLDKAVAYLHRKEDLAQFEAQRKAARVVTEYLQS